MTGLHILCLGFEAAVGERPLGYLRTHALQKKGPPKKISDASSRITPGTLTTSGRRREGSYVPSRSEDIDLK